jgi:hypothetical protein
MTRTTRLPITTLAAVATLALTATFGSVYYLHAHDAPVKRRPWPKPTPPPPASPIYEESKERAPDEAEIAAEAATHLRRVALGVERAMLSNDRDAREAAFTFLLPELVQIEPRLVVDMIAAMKPGEPRDTLRTELARHWISRDRDAAIAWMKSLGDAERRASARVAVNEVYPTSREHASYIAQQLGIDAGPG